MIDRHTRRLGNAVPGVVGGLALAAVVSVAFGGGGQVTGGGGLSRVVLSSSAGNLATGSGTSGNPMLVSWSHDSSLSGTGSGGSVAGLSTTSVTPGSYTTADITVDATGRLTAASSGTSGVPTARQIATGTGLVGGGDLSADRTLSLATMANNTVKANISGSTAAPSDVSLTALAQAMALKLGQYGSGADGSFTANGAATTPCMTLAGSTYTSNRECAFSSLTVNSGITIKPAGWPIFVSGTLTVSGGGSVTSDGNAASASTNGAATWTATSLLPSGTAGGSSVGVGVGGAGVAASNVSPSLCTAGTAARGTAGVGSSPPGSSGASCQGGGGGAGGSSSNAQSGNSGGGGGTITLSASGLGDLQERGVATSSYLFNAGHLGAPSGGGGGGGFTSGGTGGGGGGAGGWLVIHCFHCSVSGTVSAKGGNGGNGNPAVGAIAGGGGGGGGSGGICVIDTADSTAPTCSVAGGSGGTGAAAISTGQPGGAGGTGGVGVSIAFTGL